MTQIISKNKNTAKTLSEQVQEILQNRGFSFLYNEQDFKVFRNRAKNAFNKPLEIANEFITECNEPSDYNEYLY